MNWEALGATGEMLSAVAVFVTLWYLATQVRHGRREIERSISLGRAESLSQLQLNRANNAHLGSVWVRATAALGSGPSDFDTAMMEQAGLNAEDARMLGFELYA